MTDAAPRLLIVDDDLSTTQTFAKILTLEGYDVRTASTAESGLAEVEAGRPDAIILDLRMPFINGLGLLYRLRAAETAIGRANIAVKSCMKRLS